MKSATLVALGSLAALTLTTGCQNTRSARIKDNAAFFSTLDPHTKSLIADGLFDHGFTPELLYLSLGKPNRVVKSETDRGSVEIWSYRNYLYGSEGAVKIGGSTPGGKPGGTVISSSAPGGPSLMSTKASPAQPTVTDVNDVALGTLLLELVDGRVVAARVLK